MGAHHRAPSSSSERRPNSSKRERKRVGFVLEGEHQSKDSVSAHFSVAGSAAGAAADVSRARDVDLAFDRQRSAAGRATFLQDRGYGRIGDRRKNRKANSRNPRRRTRLLRATGRGRYSN